LDKKNKTLQAAMQSTCSTVTKCLTCGNIKPTSTPQPLYIIDMNKETDLEDEVLSVCKNDEQRCESGCAFCPKMRKCTNCGDSHTCERCVELLRNKNCGNCKPGCYIKGPFLHLFKLMSLAPKLLVCNFRDVDHSQTRPAPLSLLKDDSFLLKAFTIFLPGHYVSVLIVRDENQKVLGGVLLDDGRVRNLDSAELNSALQKAELGFYEKKGDV
jgi:hypothetical protein